MSGDAVERTKADPNRSRREDELVAEIERLRANPMSNDPLARLFAELWTAFLLGRGIEGDELEDIFEDTGLATWSVATEEDVKASYVDGEVGDQILKLTPAGRAIYWRGRPPAGEATP